MANLNTISSGRITVRLVSVLSAMTILIGCVPTTVRQIDQLEAVGEDPRILVMTPDVKYYLLTARGIPEPHAEWTAAARENFATALQAFAEETRHKSRHGGRSG